MAPKKEDANDPVFAASTAILHRRRPRYELRQPDHRLDCAKRPLEELLIHLPLLTVGPSGQLDLLQSPPGLLLDLAGHAEAGAGALNLGVAAVGTLMAYAAVAMEDGSISADAIEALGWMLGELGVVSAYCLALAAKCRQVRDDGEHSYVAAPGPHGRPGRTD